MRKIILLFLAVLAFASNANDREVILHHGGSSQGLDQIYIEHPRVAYDDELNELYVYFGSYVANITFTRPGSYDMTLSCYTQNNTLVADYSFQAYVI